ncbi:non-ribosomal peptide synthetase [Hyphomicrobiales bacterium]|jgi:amino acid adenylation domain-containing protein|uniref:non-ribosomal peptide synthetase n=1 Tax=Rhizobium sp. 11_C7_N12_5 TaxID=3240770 RepID=UPI000DE1A1BD
MDIDIHAREIFEPGARCASGLAAASHNQGRALVIERSFSGISLMISPKFAALAGAPGPEPRRFVDEFTEIAATYANEVAVESGDTTLTYRALDELSTVIAINLASRGIVANQAVGVWTGESGALIATIVAIFKINAVYVPIDRTLPDSRAIEILTDGQAKIVVLDHHQPFGSLPCPSVYLSELIEPNPNPVSRSWEVLATSRICYQTYTSGSTGRPKSIRISEQSMMGYLGGIIERYELPLRSSLITTASLSFDASIREIFCALLTGSTLYLIQRGKGFDADGYVRVLQEKGITAVLSMTPSILKVIAVAASSNRIEALPALRLLCVGGEVFDQRIADVGRRLFPNAVLINHYGPSECTMTSTAWIVPAGDKLLDRLPVGTPNRDTSILIIDAESGEVCEVSQDGEVWIVGRGVCADYSTPLPCIDDQHLKSLNGWPAYRTGDIGHIAEDENLYILGRSDEQIKIRGIRVEPTQVSRILTGIDGIDDAVTVSVLDDRLGYQLHSYVVLNEGSALTSDVVKEKLRQELPAYLLPASITFISSFPVNRHGKLDKGALPKPHRATATTEAPQTRLEADICRTFAEILGTATVDPNASFFELGGHSLLATYLVLAINEREGCSLPLENIFANPTPRLLARNIEAGN